MLGLCILLSLFLSWLWQYRLSWGSFHSCEQGMIRGLVIHLGWSRCLGLPIAIIIPIHTNPPLPGLSAAKGTDYHKKKNYLEGPGRATTIGVRTDMKGRFFVLSDIYLAQAEQEKRCGHKDRSPRSTLWY